MRIFVTFYFAFLIFTWNLKPAYAVTSFSWQSCVDTAKKNNPDLLASERSYMAAKANQDSTYGAYFPQVTGNLSFSRTGSESWQGSHSDSYTAGLSATQNLFSGLQDDAKIVQAKAASKVAEVEWLETKARISFELKSAFVNLVYAQNLLSFTNDIIKRREYNARMVQLKFESGAENKGSVLLSKAYLEESKLEHFEAENSLNLAKVRLVQALGIEIDSSDIAVSGVVPTTNPPSEFDIKSLVLTSPDYVKALARQESAQAGITLAKSSFYPSLNLTANSGNSDLKWFPDNNQWSVGVNLSFPLFSGGRDYFSTKSAGESYRAAEFAKQSVTVQSFAKAKVALSAFQLAIQRLKVDELFSEAAPIRQKIAREQYNNGLIEFDDWDAVERDHIYRQKNLLQSQRDRVTAEAAWEQVQGKGVIE